MTFYMNDICENILSSKLYIFADDIKVVLAFPPAQLNNSVCSLNRDLTMLCEWSDMWGMKFSSEKSHFMCFGCSVPINSLFLNNAPISQSPHVRDLGFRYSRSLNFQEQVHYILSRAKQRIGMVHRTLRLRESKIEVYKTCIRPLFEYCNTIYSSMNRGDCILLEKLQRAFTKSVIGFSSPLTYRERCSMPKLEPLWLRRIQLNLCFFFKIINASHLRLSSNFRFSDQGAYTLRHRRKRVSTFTAKTRLRRNFFLVKYSSLWNRLPECIRVIPTLSIFSRMLKKFLTIPNLINTLNLQLLPEDIFNDGVPGF